MGGRLLNEYKSLPSPLPVCHLTSVLTKLPWQQSISLLALQWQHDDFFIKYGLDLEKLSGMKYRGLPRFPSA